VPQRTVLLLVVAATVAYSDELNRYNLPTLCNDNGFPPAAMKMQLDKPPYFRLHSADD